MTKSVEVQAKLGSMALPWDGNTWLTNKNNTQEEWLRLLGNFHKPLVLIHQRADRMKTTIIEN